MRCLTNIARIATGHVSCCVSMHVQDQLLPETDYYCSRHKKLISFTDMQEAFIVSPLRTPIGKYGGALSAVRADDLAAHILRSLVERIRIPADRIDDVILGCANQAGEDNRNVA